MDKKNENFRKLCHSNEALDFIKSLGGKVENAEIFVKEDSSLGMKVYDIRANGKNLKDILDRNIIFNLNILYNEREKYYEEDKDIFDKFIRAISF